MALELRTAGERLLSESRVFEQAVEEFAVFHHRGEQPHGQGIAFFFREAAADFPQQTGQIDAARAYAFAGFAAHAVLAEYLGLVMSVEEIGQDEADGSNVDIAHLVSAHQTEHRADVGAGSAAYAAENLREQRILGDFTAAVVDKDHMHDFFAVGVGLAFSRAVHERDIGSQALGRGVARQHLKRGERHVEGGHQFVQAGNGHMHAGQGGHHAGVAFVGHGGNRAVFRNGEVASAHAHVGGDELAAQLYAGHLDQTLNVLRVLLHAGFPGEVFSHLIAGKVNGGHDHVGGAFMAQLDDPFPQVGFIHDQPLFFQIGVELDFLGRHGFGLDYPLDVIFLGDAGDDGVGFLRRGRAVDMYPAFFRLFLELLVQLFHVLAGVVLGVGNLRDQAALVHFLEDGFAVGAVGHGKGVQRIAQELVFQGLAKLLVIFRVVFRRAMHDLGLQ